MSVRDLPKLLRDDPALLEVRGRTNALIAVSEPARAFTIAGLVETTKRRPYLLAVLTSTEADRLAHDLGAFLGPDRVDLFPAWETLPFERVSPSTETMGRRMRTMWHLHQAREGGDAPVPRIIVAPGRALVQRLGPHAA